jgi:hypothetical protein
VTLIPKYKLSGVAAKSSMLLLVVISSVAAILFQHYSYTRANYSIPRVKIMLEGL